MTEPRSQPIPIARRLIVAGYALIVALGAAGCSSGVKEGMAENPTLSPEALRQEEEIGKANLNSMKK